MIVSEKYKFVYFPPVKTGTSSIASILDGKYEAKLFRLKEEAELGLFPSRHQLFLLKEWEDYTTFISVRNPYDRFLSIFNYFSRDKPEETIEHYTKPEWKVKSISEQLKLSTLYPNCVSPRLDYIIKLENIEEDFNKLPFLKQYEKIPTLNISIKKLDALSPKIKNFVETKFLEDFERFNYPMDKKIKFI